MARPLSIKAMLRLDPQQSNQPKFKHDYPQNLSKCCMSYKASIHHKPFFLSIEHIAAVVHCKHERPLLVGLFIIGGMCLIELDV
jgi:hypothetical protein